MTLTVHPTSCGKHRQGAGAIAEAELALIQKATAPASGLQSDRHPGQTKRRFKTKLYSMQFKDHTLLILQLCHFGAADDSEAGRSCPKVPAISAAVRKLRAVPCKLTVATPIVPRLTPPMLNR